MTSAQNTAVPPSETFLFFCTKCGRTDRFQKMGHLSHFHEGKRCNGRVVRLRFILAEESQP